jgi:hypothetical protein
MAVWSNTELSAVKEHFGRLDAEFYKPEFLKTDRTLSAIDGITLRRVASKIDVGHVGPMVKHYTEDGILLLQTQNVREFFLDLEHTIRITPTFHSTLVKSQVHKGDLLIARSGSFGSAAIYFEDAIVNSADIIIVEIDDPRIDPVYAVAFLNTRHGSSQLIRFASGGVQGHVNLRILEHLRIPILDSFQQKSVAALVRTAYSIQSASGTAYREAEQVLEAELDLDKLTVQKPVGFTARFSELEMSHRSDAQHYQPRFARLIDHLATFSPRRVRDIRIVNRRGLQPVYSESGAVDVVNSQHLGPRQIDYAGLQKTSDAAFSAAKEAHIQMNDILIYTTGAYIGRTNVYLSEAPALASNHVNILRLKPGIDAAYMALVLQSLVGQFQTQKHARGSAQAELYPADIDRFVVPLLDPARQGVIGNLVRESLDKQHESQKLLEQAKARVEQLIEEAAGP